MKYYTITVNGNTYEVSVEESNGVSSMAPAPVAAAPAVAVQRPAPVVAAPASAPAPTPKASSGASGNIKVSSPMPGKIIALKVNVGQAIKKGDVVLVLEAMKMENEIVAPEDGIVASLNVSAGQSVEAGDLLATLN
jgi:biotin carboxyl carrier protein